MKRQWSFWTIPIYLFGPALLFAETVKDEVQWTNSACLKFTIAGQVQENCEDSDPSQRIYHRTITKSPDSTSIEYTRLDTTNSPDVKGSILPAAPFTIVVEKDAYSKLNEENANIPATPEDVAFVSVDVKSLNTSIDGIKDCASNQNTPCSSLERITNIGDVDWYVSPQNAAKKNQWEVRLVISAADGQSTEEFRGEMTITGSGLSLSVQSEEIKKGEVDLGEGKIVPFENHQKRSLTFSREVQQ